MPTGLLKDHPKGVQFLDYTTLRRIIDFVRNSGTFDPRFFHWMNSGGQNFLTLYTDALKGIVGAYDGPFFGAIEETKKVRIRDGYWIWDEDAGHFTVSGGATTYDGVLFQDVDFTGATEGTYYVYLTLNNSSTTLTYSLNKSLIRPNEFVSGNIINRVLGTVVLNKKTLTTDPETYDYLLSDWWQEQFGNVFVGGGGGSGLTAVEVRWYAPDFTGNPPQSGVDYLVDNTILNQEGPTVTGFALERGRFWHTVPELDGSTMIHHKFQKCFRG
jgi:hypothetical protein